EALLARRFALRAHQPERADPLVPRRLRAEELPGGAVGAELALVGRREPLRAVLVGVQPRALRGAGAHRLEPRGPHPARGLERLRAPDVDRAPDALRPARREPDREAVVVEAAADPIDPAEAERLVQRVGVGHAAIAGVDLEDADQQRLGVPVILFEPRA